VGFANLALGVLGIIAMGRRDGFREATVIAASVFGLGATIVHAIDIIETGNLAPGNTLQNVSNLLRPALLIGFLVALRRTERSPGSETTRPTFEAWRAPRVRAVGLMTVSVATGFGLGFGIGQPMIGTFLGIVVGAGSVVFTISRTSRDRGIHPTS
jgi:hypothetical protein